MAEGSLSAKGEREAFRLTTDLILRTMHDTLDDEDDTRSMATAMPHTLESVDEEDEDNLDSEHERVDEPESVRPLEEDMIGVVISGSESSPFASSASD